MLKFYMKDLMLTQEELRGILEFRWYVNYAYWKWPAIWDPRIDLAERSRRVTDSRAQTLPV